MHVRLTASLTGICAALIMLTGAHAAGAAEKTVSISGKAYVFNHMDTGISGATIKVRELPKLSATTDQFGDYVLKVPNDTNVTPYILSGEGLLTKRKFEGGSPDGTVQTHWNEVDLQTFHTRGADIENANFQSPADGEFAGLKALLSVPARADGRPEQCAIVTTASARNVRGVDYHTFWANTPHGVAGATSIEYPAIDGPIYFNEGVIPDKSKTSTSDDGGIIWPVVPAGRYRIETTSPDARFASFLATCEPGRIINANPPWGNYELGPGEKPLGASNVAGSVRKIKAYRKGRKRFLAIRVDAGEKLGLDLVFRSKNRRPTVVGGFVSGHVRAGKKFVKVRMPGASPRHRLPLKLKITLDDASGVKFTSKHRVTLPKVKKKHRRR